MKSTISDLGYSDFSEYYIGHSSVSTYYRKTDKEKIELFRKIEPHLTFLDYPTLERKGADVEAKVENLEQENQRLRHSDQTEGRRISNIIRSSHETYGGSTGNKEAIIYWSYPLTLSHSTSPSRILFSFFFHNFIPTRI